MGGKNQKPKIVVISAFPNSDNSTDGMIQRVKEIDSLIAKDYTREYISIGIKRNVIAEQKFYGSVKEHNLNVFLHQLKMINLLKSADLVLLHSVTSCLLIFTPLVLSRKKFLIDIHGVVPEEFQWMRKKIQGLIYGVIERLVFKKAEYLISVTDSMIEFYHKKYPTIKENRFLHLPIFNSDPVIRRNVNRQNGPSRPRIIYAGGVQAWQNIELMLKFVNLYCDRYDFEIYVPSHHLEAIRAKIKRDAVIVDSLPQSELALRYRQADLGFLLRDDIVVNRVASPTKLNEYLSNGIVPILLQPNIGDINHYGYAYYLYSQFSDDYCLDMAEVKAKSRHNSDKYVEQRADSDLGKLSLIEAIRQALGSAK